MTGLGETASGGPDAMPAGSLRVLILGLSGALGREWCLSGNRVEDDPSRADSDGAEWNYWEVARCP
jgi:hypothetical protein